MEMQQKTSGTPVLCMVDYGQVYFTTQDLALQHGDDWGNAPYEHNAGDPYKPCWHNRPEHRREKLCRCDGCQRDWNEDGTPKWEILYVCVDGVELLEPMAVNP